MIEEEFLIRQTTERIKIGPQPYPPVFVREIGTRVLKKNKPAIFDAEVNSEPPAEIFWFCNGRKLQNSNFIKIYAERNRSRIVFIQPQEGEYKALAKNSAGQAVSIGQLEFEKGPKFFFKIKKIIFRNFQFSNFFDIF